MAAGPGVGGRTIVWTTADLSKCFNTVPRAVVIAIAIQLGLPRSLVYSWHNTFQTLQRRFIINGGCTDALTSVTEYPEGDPLSVTAMLMINILVHNVIDQKSHAQMTRTQSMNARSSDGFIRHHGRPVPHSGPHHRQGQDVLLVYQCRPHKDL